MRPSHCLVIFTLVMLMAIITGCSGGDGDDSPEVTTILPENVVLSNLILAPENIHDNINKFLDEKVLENRNIAKNPGAYNLDDPDEALKLLESWGRIKGIVKGFGNPQDDQAIYLSCAVYDSLSGARSAFNYKKDHDIESFNRAAIEKRGGTQIEFHLLDEIDIGDDSIGYKYGYINKSQNPQGTRQHFMEIHFLAQFVICGNVWASRGPGILTDELLEIALRSHQKVMDELTMVNSPVDQGSTSEDISVPPANVTEQVTEAEPAETVSAQELLAAYKDDPISGAAEYKNKTIRITGVTDRIDPRANSLALVFQAGNLSMEVSCYFGPGDIDDLAQVQEGQGITLKGTVGDYIIDVNIYECSVWEPK